MCCTTLADVLRLGTLDRGFAATATLQLKSNQRYDTHSYEHVLLQTLCAHVQVTLQYCIWDQWKEVAATAPRRLLCLAGLVGHLLANFTLPLSIVKPVSFR
jgi:hypothetical protein